VRVKKGVLCRRGQPYAERSQRDALESTQARPLWGRPHVAQPPAGVRHWPAACPIRIRPFGRVACPPLARAPVSGSLGNRFGG
jgi:hypothetical protein